MDCLKLGRLERLRIGHDNSGFGPGWFLDKVSAEHILSNCFIYHLVQFGSVMYIFLHVFVE